MQMKVASHLHYDLAPACFIAKAKVIHAKMRCCCGRRRYFIYKDVDKEITATWRLFVENSVQFTSANHLLWSRSAQRSMNSCYQRLYRLTWGNLKREVQVLSIYLIDPQLLARGLRRDVSHLVGRMTAVRTSGSTMVSRTSLYVHGMTYGYLVDEMWYRSKHLNNTQTFIKSDPKKYIRVSFWM